ncbi:MAG: flagellar brake protein [Gallionella sp.]|jgi:c-di-GMP-binding flagellar brake protein YcgR
MSEKLLPVKLNEIQVGRPLLWTVFDKSGRLLLREGALVESQRQLEGLCENGLFRNSKWDGVVKRQEPKTSSQGGESGGVGGKSAPVEKIEDLLSIKLAIGDTVQLQDVSSDKQRTFVKLIGFTNKRSVLVSHPRQDEKLSFIKEGQGFLVRGFAGTKTYEFNTNVISVCLTPYPYLHLAYPAQVKTTNMRSAVRIKLRIVCSIESQATGLKVPAIIEDMSISGARIHCSKAFGLVGDMVTVGLRMQVAGETQVFLVSAAIRNVREENDSQTGDKIIMHGMEFIQSQSMDLTLLQNFIYKSMLES